MERSVAPLPTRHTGAVLRRGLDRLPVAHRLSPDLQVAHCFSLNSRMRYTGLRQRAQAHHRERGAEARAGPSTRRCATAGCSCRACGRDGGHRIACALALRLPGDMAGQGPREARRTWGLDWFAAHSLDADDQDDLLLRFARMRAWFA
jgi:hypothetical protein